MAQNIYDNPGFFAGYSQLNRSVGGLDSAPEWPSLRAMLPDLHGRRVLDIGCGFGWFCRWAREAGAAEVVGMDVSERMLERARSMTADPAIRYQRADAEGLTLPEAAFDLAYSSLALHYIADLAPLLETLHRALVPGGRLVFSMEHPIYTALHSAIADWLVEQRHVTLAYPGQNQLAYRSHKAIHDAIAAKDPDRAERVIRAHLNQISNAYWRAMEENGGEMPS